MITNVITMVYNAVYTFVSNICMNVAWHRYADTNNKIHGLYKVMQALNDYSELKSFWSPCIAGVVTTLFICACLYIAGRIVYACIMFYRNTKNENVEVEL